MLLTFTSAIIYLVVKEFALQNLPLGVAKEIWKEWELRLVTVTSMSLQFLLVFSGRIRSKYTGPRILHVSILAFMTYQLANYSATVVLSALMRGPVAVNNSLAALWTPFFLSHLGNPYNITAFSLEDNDLWRRHLLGAVIHVFQAVYICLRFGTDFKLKMIAIPVLVAGIIKYGEKIWALRSASTSNLRTYISSSQKIMEIEKLDEEGKGRWLDKETVKKYLARGDVSGEVRFYRRAYLYFSAFRRLYSDLPLHTVGRDTAVEVIDIKSGSADEAFRIVGIELEFLYDVLYTKTPIRLHKSGMLSYAFCLITMVCSVIGFTVLVFRRRYFVIHTGERLDHDLGRHPITDILITYMLFFGTIVLDVLGGLHHAQSKWAAVKRTSRFRREYNRLMEPWILWMRSTIGVRKMAQLDLLAYSCSKLTTGRCRWLVEFLDTENLLGMGNYTKWREIDTGLKTVIFDYLKNKHNPTLGGIFNFKDMAMAEATAVSPSNHTDLEMDHLKDIDNKDFVRCVFILHTATNLLYYDDKGKYPGGVFGRARKIGKTLSDYMSYLVILRPFMLPKGINDEIRIDTDRQARSLFHKNIIAALPWSKQAKISKIMKVVTKGLMDLGEGMAQVGPPPQPVEVKNESVLGDGIVLAKMLQKLSTQLRWDHEQKWELIANLWVRMLVYAAELCPWKEHAKQLPVGGGELLTHVSLMLAHLHLKLPASS